MNEKKLNQLLAIDPTVMECGDRIEAIMRLEKEEALCRERLDSYQRGFGGRYASLHAQSARARLARLQEQRLAILEAKTHDCNRDNGTSCAECRMPACDHGDDENCYECTKTDNRTIAEYEASRTGW